MLKSKHPSKAKMRYTGLFTITGRCNDNCKFCIKYDFIKQGYSDLTLEEIKKNYFFINDKFKIHHVAISGGEPTIHPQLFKILDFFKEQSVKVYLITNLLKISTDKIFFKKISPYFNRYGDNMLMASVNDLADFSEKAKLRIEGLRKALKSGLRVGTISLIYQDNIKHLPKLAYLLRSLFQKYPCQENNGMFDVELRSIYISETPKSVLEEVLPKDFIQVKKAVQEFVSILSAPAPVASLTLWHFPLCYIKNFNQANLEVMGRRWNNRYVWVDRVHQMKKIKVLGAREQQRICSQCLLKEKCTGMCNKEYMNKYDFPSFKPIKKL